MKKILVVVAAMGFAASAFAGDPKAAEKAGAATAATPAAAGAMMTEQVFTPAKVKWTALGPDEKAGPWFAPVQGDSQKEAFTGYIKIKAGKDSGWHTHDVDYSGVAIEGNATHQDQGGKEHSLMPGQAWTSKGGVNHINKCKGKKDCVIFIAVRGPFSYHPKTAEGADVQMPAPTPAKTN